MATVIPIGEPVNDAERRAIAHLREHLPKGYTLVHNFEIRRNDQVFEVDLAIIAPHAVYLVDVKGTQGLIDVYGSKWYPQGRQPFTSPLLKLRGHARSLKGLITDANRVRPDLGKLWVDAVVLLTAPDANLIDQGERDIGDVTTLKNAARFFQNPGRIPGRPSKNIVAQQKLILKALTGAARPRKGPLILGNWQVSERLGATETYTEFRAFNTVVGPRGGHVILRAYNADPYLPESERKDQRTRIANAFKSLNQMPSHVHILGARDFFSSEHGDRLVLVTEDIPGQALRLHIDKPQQALTLDEKLRVARELLAALDHCHRHQVLHRNLTPAAILLGGDGHLRLVGFDYARAGTDRSRTIADKIVDDIDPRYTAPETYREPSNASPASDIFSAGLVLYELFTGNTPFTGPTELFDQDGVFPTRPSAHRSDLPSGLDEWLQSLCTFDPDHRPDAASALADLEALLAPSEDLQADEFIERALAATGNELRPLLRLLKNEETDWLEFKAALIPPPERQNATKADGQWAVVKAALALVNTHGGAVLLGVDDAGNPAPLQRSDPKGYLEKDGWDKFARSVLDSGLFRPKGWATFKQGTWCLEVNDFKRCIETRRATLDGEAIVVLLVRPISPQGTLLMASNNKQDQDILFVRRRGDVGVVEKITGEKAIEDWRQSRELRSPQFAALLQQLTQEEREPESPPTPPAQPEPNYLQLPPNTALTRKYIVQKKIGQGAFGVVYKVVDTLGDVTRAVKIILKDRHSTLERLKTEYRTLLRVPDHHYVVKVVDADFLPGNGPPYLVFEFVEGQDIRVLIDENRFAPEDALELLKQVTEGLVHLHHNGVFHCDIKPRNLIWNTHGAKIIDFNVSVRSEEGGQGGGSRRYLPPDLDISGPPTPAELADRDLYALGLTVYEALTRSYPWKSSTPDPVQPAKDPREQSNLSRLSPALSELVLKSIAPRRGDRFRTAEELLQAAQEIEQVWRAAEESPEEASTWLVPSLGDGAAIPPNTNPFVRHLITLYSQSPLTNSGTRGLSDLARQTYIPTLLDKELRPTVLKGEFRLVVITGNAGDGKTAFLQQLEEQARDQQATFDAPLPNGQRFNLGGRAFITNYDGSQDEKDRVNDDVLRTFFAPFEGTDPEGWPSDETRLVAINEGRLVDFLASEAARFPALRQLIEQGLHTGQDAHGVAVVNLNLRSVVSDPEEGDNSIMERLLRRITHEKFWSPCHACDLKDRCYAFHNARTFQDVSVGPQVTERLKTLYTLTHLRGRLHITLRDLGSALAYTLVGTRDCDEIHKLYENGQREEIAQGFYFNAWMGGGKPTADRLLTLLKDVDVGEAADPRLDRSLDFVGPHRDRRLFTFSHRDNYDHAVLQALFKELPRDFTGKPTIHRAQAHRRFVAMARRRAFFERRDDGWRDMLPYRSAQQMLRLVRGALQPEQMLSEVLQAINRGEGLTDPGRLGGSLALQVRQVEGGTIRSYRLFPAEHFSLEVSDEASRARFVEHTPNVLVLRYAVEDGEDAELLVNLDIFEMLQRLNEGYKPSLEAQQGYYLSLSVFKNVLGSAPYQEVLLTRTGHDFYTVQRHPNGRLEMNRTGMGRV